MRLLQHDQKAFRLPLDSIISLEESGISGGAFAMREINQGHVEHLAHSNPAEWPPIKVTKSDMGYILIDGYHRKLAAPQLSLTEILADCKSYSNENDVIEAAFRANLKHGLKASNETRSDYAYWLHLTYPKLRQEEIAERVGVTQSVVSKAIARREARLAGEDAPEEQTKRVIKTCRSFTRVALKFLTEMEEIDYEAIVQTLNAVAKTDHDRERIAKLGEILADSAYPLRERQLKTSPLTVR